MNKYENGKIYTIRCRNDDALIYVGSTIQPLHQRWSGHKCDSLRNPNTPLYQSVNDNWDDWYIELYVPFSCNNRNELNKREGEVIREISTLNTRIEGRTIQEYRLDNKEKNKIYRSNNKDVINEKKKAYRDKNKDLIKEHDKEYRLANLEKIKKYDRERYLANKEKKLEYHREYRLANIEKIREKNKEQSRKYREKKKLEKQQKLP